MHSSSRLYRKFVVLAVGALALSAIAASPAMARGPRTTSSAQCFVTPNPVSNDVSGMYTVVGVGFQAGVQLSAFVGTGTILMGVTDSTGSFAASDWAQTL